MKNKAILGLLIGGSLGVLDSLMALLSPLVAQMRLSVVVGSTLKGLLTGILAGWFARKVHSIPLGIVFGCAVGLLFSFVVAAMPKPTGQHYYFEIMLPGSIIGVVVGFATQRYGGRSQAPGL